MHINDPSAVIVGGFVFVQGSLVILSGRQQRAQEAKKQEQKEAADRAEADRKDAEEAAAREKAEDVQSDEREYTRLKEGYARLVGECDRCEAILKEKKAELDMRDAFLDELGTRFSEIRSVLSPPGTMALLRKRRDRLNQVQQNQLRSTEKTLTEKTLTEEKN